MNSLDISVLPRRSAAVAVMRLMYSWDRPSRGQSLRILRYGKPLLSTSATVGCQLGLGARL